MTPGGPHRARHDLYGAQPERTALAWQRSLLGVVLGSLVLMMTALRGQVWVVVVLGAVLTVGVAVAMITRRPGAERPLVLLVVAVVVLGALGAALAVSQVVTLSRPSPASHSSLVSPASTVTRADAVPPATGSA